MLSLIIAEQELFDEKNNQFLYIKSQVLRLEHSLVSISKWEAKWEKPFLSNSDKSDEEIIDYIRFMTITQNVDDNVYLTITKSQIDEVIEYIGKPMTATRFSNIKESKSSNSYLSSEVIYYLMFSYNIPIECQKWHLNRLLTLIKVFDVKNRQDEKMSLNDIYSSNAELNAARRAKYNTKG